MKTTSLRKDFLLIKRALIQWCFASGPPGLVRWGQLGRLLVFVLPFNAETIWKSSSLAPKTTGWYDLLGLLASIS